MHDELTRRDLLRLAGAGLSGLGLAAIVGCGSDDADRSPTRTPGIVVYPPPETTTIRLPKDDFPTHAPLYLAEEFLLAEGFTDVQYIDVQYVGQPGSSQSEIQPIATGELDISLEFPSALVVEADAGNRLVVLAGVYTPPWELFGNDRVQSLRDLKGKRIHVFKRDATDSLYALWAVLLAYVGIDLEHEVEFVELTGDLALARFLEGKVDAFLAPRPASTALRSANIGHVFLDGAADAPWSQYFGLMAAGNGDFVKKHPAATERALRAILKAADVCAREPERAARYIVDKGFTTSSYDQALDAINAVSYTAWREFNPEDTMRFYALRLHDAGLVKSRPDELIVRSTDWHFLEEIKRELGVT